MEDVERPPSRADSFVSAKRKESPIMAKPGTDAATRRQEFDTYRPVPAGTAGAAGCPEHNAPEQGAAYGGGNPIRFPCEVADHASGQRREPPRIGPGRDKVRATALGTARCNQGQSQKQYDSSCPQ